nr:hypothetical transcript [Hymenolepis microstoma]
MSDLDTQLFSKTVVAIILFIVGLYYRFKNGDPEEKEKENQIGDILYPIGLLILFLIVVWLCKSDFNDNQEIWSRLELE